MSEQLNAGVREAEDQMHRQACNSRFTAIEKANRERDRLIRETHAKVTNGFGDRIEAANEKVTELKTDTTKRIDDLKTEMDKRFDKTDIAIEGIRKTLNTTIIAIIISVLSAVGTGVAALLTGLFGLIDKLGG